MTHIDPTRAIVPASGRVVAAVHDLTKSYGRGGIVVQALAGVSLHLEEGSFVALVGPSGSGKSSLLNLIGLLDVPDSGDILIDGIRVADLEPRAVEAIRRERLGFVFQTFNLVPVLTALENVEMALIMSGLTVGQRRRRAKEMLAVVGLEDRFDHLPRQLSGGQQQRVAIARALVSSPKLVLADEPTANLDSDTAVRLVSLMRKLNREQGTAFLFSTHDDRVIAEVDRVCRLRDGKIQEDVHE